MDELSQRAERVERAAWSSLVWAASPALRASLGLEVSERFGATFLSATTLPHLLVNRAIGLGSTGIDNEAVPAAVHHYRERDIAKFWIHVAREQRRTELPALLRSQGVVPYPRSWMKFTRQAAPIQSRGIVRRARPREANEVSAVLAATFGFPNEAARLFSGALRAAGWHFVVIEAGAKGRRRWRPIRPGRGWIPGVRWYAPRGSTAWISAGAHRSPNRHRPCCRL